MTSAPRSLGCVAKVIGSGQRSCPCSCTAEHAKDGAAEHAKWRVWLPPLSTCPCWLDSRGGVLWCKTELLVPVMAWLLGYVHAADLRKLVDKFGKQWVHATITPKILVTSGAPATCTAGLCPSVFMSHHPSLLLFQKFLLNHPQDG